MILKWNWQREKLKSLRRAFNCIAKAPLEPMEGRMAEAAVAINYQITLYLVKKTDYANFYFDRSSAIR